MAWEGVGRRRARQRRRRGGGWVGGLLLLCRLLLLLVVWGILAAMGVCVVGMAVCGVGVLGRMVLLRFRQVDRSGGGPGEVVREGRKGGRCCCHGLVCVPVEGGVGEWIE